MMYNNCGDYDIGKNMRRTLVIYIMLLIAGLTMAQTQQGYVKTKGRMVNGKHVKGTALTGAVVTIKGQNAVAVKNADGSFTFPVTNRSFFIQSVTKNGYQLVDADAAPKGYAYSTNPLILLLETPSQQAEDRLTAERKIRRTLQRQLLQREDELEELKAQNKLSQEEFQYRLQQLYNDQQNNEKLIADMAQEYSQMDYDQMDELNRQISDAILNGELIKADSLLRSKGDINSRIEKNKQKQKAETVEAEELAKRQQNLELSQAGTQKEKEDIAADCYKFFDCFKLANQHDSAAYYIELRAGIDTTQSKWQYDAGIYLSSQNLYSKSLLYYKRAMAILQRQAKNNEGEIMLELAEVMNNLSLLYYKNLRFKESEALFKEALNIFRSLSNDNRQAYECNIAMVLNNLAILYSNTERLDESEQIYKETLEINRRLAEENPQLYKPDLASTLNNLAGLYLRKFHYEESRAMFEEALDIYRSLAIDKPQTYNPKIATVIYNMALVNEYNFKENISLHKESLKIRRRLAKDNPQAYELDVANSLTALANQYAEFSRYQESEPLYLEALDIYRRYAAFNPESFEIEMLTIQKQLARYYNNTKRYADAEKMYMSTLEILQRLVIVNPDLYDSDVADMQNELANIYFDTEQYDNAEKLFLSALENYKSLVAVDPKMNESSVAMVYGNLGVLYKAMKHYDNAEEMYHMALDIYQRLAEVTPDVYLRNVANTKRKFASLYSDCQRFAEAKDMFLSVLTIYQRLSKNNITGYKYTVEIASTLGSLSLIDILLKDFKEAELYARRSIKTTSTLHWINSYLGAALLFQGNTAEAQSVYVQYKEELKESFLDDFKQFAEAGVIPKEYEADVEKIKKMLNE